MTYNISTRSFLPVKCFGTESSSFLWLHFLFSFWQL